MTTNSSTKTLVSEICAENNITCTAHSKGYILRLTKNGQVRHLYGNYWDLNSAAADHIACDKCGCYILLQAGSVPAIEHTLVFNPLERGEWAGNEGTLASALTYFEKHNRKLVVKPNKGTQGQHVYYCDTALSLERALAEIFATQPDAALSPYVEIGTEYRVFYLAGRAHFMYGKKPVDSWKHNLAAGAAAVELNDPALEERLSYIALRAAQCIGITFASIDIAEDKNGDLLVMEINAGVMANRLLEQHPHLRPTIKGLFAEAVERLFSQKRIAGTVGLQV